MPEVIKASYEIYQIDENSPFDVVYRTENQGIKDHVVTGASFATKQEVIDWLPGFADVAKSFLDVAFPGKYIVDTYPALPYLEDKHTHYVSHLRDATAIGQALVQASSKSAALDVVMTPHPPIPNASVTAPNNAATNAPTDAPTNLNVITTLLGTLTGEVNATNTRQNQIAVNVNANAEKLNEVANILRDLAQKVNAMRDCLVTNKLLEE